MLKGQGASLPMYLCIPVYSGYFYTVMSSNGVCIDSSRYVNAKNLPYFIALLLTSLGTSRHYHLHTVYRTNRGEWLNPLCGLPVVLPTHLSPRWLAGDDIDDVGRDL